MPRPGRNHISPNTKFRIPAPWNGLSRFGANGRQLMSWNDCAPTARRASGSLGVGNGSSGSGGGTVSPALAVDARPLFVDDHVEPRRFGPAAVDREMQYGLPHFGDAQVATVQRGVHVIA